jgi:hypothetical protein
MRKTQDIQKKNLDSSCKSPCPEEYRGVDAAVHPFPSLNPLRRIQTKEKKSKATRYH